MDAGDQRPYRGGSRRRSPRSTASARRRGRKTGDGQAAGHERMGRPVNEDSPVIPPAVGHQNVMLPLIWNSRGSMNRGGLPPARVEGVLNGKDTAAVQRIVRVEIDLQPAARRELEHLAETKVETRHPRLRRACSATISGTVAVRRAAGQIATERMARRIASDVSRRHRVTRLVLRSGQVLQRPRDHEALSAAAGSRST